MDSTDKIKILLEDFAEKEALNREEIGEIEKQINELEQLIVVSKKRMEKVALDKEKVYKMRNRYAEGDWSDVLAKASEKIKSEKEAKESEAQQENQEENVDANGGGKPVGLETRDVPVIKVDSEADSEVEASQEDESKPESVPIPEAQVPESDAGQSDSAPAPVPIPSPPENPVPQPSVSSEDLNQVFESTDTEAQQNLDLESTVPPGAPEQAPSPPPEHDVMPVALNSPDNPPILPGIPNPPTGFDAMQVPPGVNNVEMPQAVSPQGPGPGEEQESSLFPFSQGSDIGQDLDQDAPWSGMSWESSGNSEQVEENQQNVQPVEPAPQVQPAPNPQLQPAPPQQMQQVQPIQPLQQAAQPPQMPPQPQPSMPPQMQPPAPPAPGPDPFGQMAQPPQPQAPVPPQQQAVLMQNQGQQPMPAAPAQPQPETHQAFDISDALKSDDEVAEEKEGQKDDENVKKINDALRGLFS